jgi:4-diphosphocytidyl-2-C-methyl-D-erythritol kinase
VLAAAGGPVPDASRMAAIARGLGADVPFFMAPLPSVGRGIGDILEPIDLPGLSMVLVYFRKQLSTASVYRTFDLVRPPESQAVFDFRSSQAEKRWRQVSDMTQVARLLENDLEQASFSLMQSLATDREVVVREGAIAALMTGSGPSLFGLCETVEKAKELQYRLGARGFSSMTATITV